MMPDVVLPFPEPGWDNPEPYDGPTPEEVEAFAKLHALADVLRAWVAGAYVVGTSPAAWAELSDSITEIARMCTDLGRTVDGETGDE